MEGVAIDFVRMHAALRLVDERPFQVDAHDFGRATARISSGFSWLCMYCAIPSRLLQVSSTGA